MRPAGSTVGDGWEDRLRRVNLPVGYDDWRAAVVLAREGGELKLGFEDGSDGRMSASARTCTINGGSPAARCARAM